MKPLIERLTKLQSSVSTAIDQLDLATQRATLSTLDAQMAEPTFWSDPSAAEGVSREAAGLREELLLWDTLQSDIATTRELAEMSDESSEAEFKAQVKELETRTEAAMIAVKLSGPHDRRPAIMQISAGAGGTDAQDWAEMLLTMYSRYCERTGLTAQLVDISRGEEAGIKSATLEIHGPFAFGKLQSEKGVHRLVRLSPFNSDSLRQTSFALVDVIPEIPMEELELDEKDLRIDVYRSGGHGGQSVNTTDSAVRITHLPTGLVVAIQNERSQLKNKQKAMSILAARLADLAREQHLESIAELRGTVKSADWGQQIRSYVLHPYQKVKDHRTDYETSDTDGVLSGEIDAFIEAYLTQQLSK